MKPSVSKSFSTTAPKGRIFIDPHAVELLSIPAVLSHMHLVRYLVTHAANCRRLSTSEFQN